MGELGYPPPHHVLRDLPFEIEVLADGQRAHLDGSGSWSIGALATVVDVLGGSLCAGAVAPDWMATSSLTLRTGVVPDGMGLVVDASTLRVGRRSVTIEAELRTDEGGVVGDAMLAFSRLERRSSNLDLSDRSESVGARYGFGPADGVDPVPWDRAIDQRVLDAATGATETEVTPYVLNSFGAVNGGVVAGIAAAAGAVSVGHGPGAVDEVSVHHLGQGRQGPVRTSARALFDSAGHRVVRVELRDAGAAEQPEEPDGRLMAVAHVVVGNARGGV